jgi:hypothetical protein
MVYFSKPRLEGRALEQALAGSKRRGVRMFNSRTQEWALVTDSRALCAVALMKQRAASLKADMAKAGLYIQGADRAARVGDGNISVDVRAWMTEWSTEALLEVKWTRQSFSEARAEAKKKIPVLKEACTIGRWLQADGKPGKTIKAAAVGVLLVGPRAWDCSVHSIVGSKTATFGPTLLQSGWKKKSSGVSNWESWRGSAAPGSSKWPSGWSDHNARRVAVTRGCTLVKACGWFLDCQVTCLEGDLVIFREAFEHKPRKKRPASPSCSGTTKVARHCAPAR